jgi:hypothetical protein
LHLPPYLAAAFHEKINTHSVVNFQRKTVICVDCDHNLPELGNSFSNHSFKISNKHLPAKVSINPDKAGCLLIHFSLCSTDIIRLDSRIAYISHFDNFHSHRVSKDEADYKFHDYDASLLSRCERNDVVHSLQSAVQQYRTIMVESRHPFRDVHYFIHEIIVLTIGSVMVIFALFRLFSCVRRVSKR